MYIQGYDNMHLSLFRIFLRNSGLQVMDVHNKDFFLFGSSLQSILIENYK